MNRKQIGAVLAVAVLAMAALVAAGSGGAVVGVGWGGESSAGRGSESVGTAILADAVPGTADPGTREACSAGIPVSPGPGPHAAVPAGAATTHVTGGSDAVAVELRAGFNLVSWLGGDAVAVTEAVAALGDSLEALFLWDAEAQAFLTYAPSLPAALNTAETLSFGDAVWIRVNEPVTWLSVAPALSCASPLAAGTIPFEDAEVFIEFNSTDEDVGFHGTFDFGGWTTAVICGPDGAPLVTVRADGGTERHGLSELFFEGAEPPLDVQSLDEFLARFPAGDYLVLGETVDGDALQSEVTFTHDIPAAPVILSPAEEEELALDEVVIAWEPVTGVEIDSYEVFVAPPEGEGEPALDIDLELTLPPSVTQVRIPAELLAPGTVYEFEVLAVEESGNKTISAGEFVTAP